MSLSDRALEAFNEHWAVAAIGASEIERAGDLACQRLARRAVGRQISFSCPSGCHPPAQGLRSLTGVILHHGHDGNRRQIAAAARTVSEFDIATECGWGHGDLARAPDLLDSHRIALESR